MTSLKAISAKVFPRYSRYLDTVNRNALLAKWIKEHSPIRTFTISRDLYVFLNSTILANEPIDFLEFGVYRGESLKYWTKINTNPNSRFFGFDSFEGLPENWNLAFRTLRKGHFSTNGAIPEVEDQRVSFVKGWFQKSLDDFLLSYYASNRILIRIDCDLYSSSMYCLSRLDPFLKKHSILLFDDFSSPLDIFRSFQDYVDSYWKEYRVVAARNPYYQEMAIELLGSRLSP